MYTFVCYLDTYEEAKNKAKIAQELSDLSETENLNKSRKSRPKVVDGSPSPDHPQQNKKHIDPLNHLVSTLKYYVHMIVNL